KEDPTPFHPSSEADHEARDTLLVQQLIAEDLGTRRFHFSTVMEAASGYPVIPLDPSHKIHAALLHRLRIELTTITETLGKEDSPVREERRINEVSRHFEDALLSQFGHDAEWKIEIPPTREGRLQRSGYPDLKITHLASSSVFYLDPKLVEQNSWNSSFRSFYFEPKAKTLKINDPAVHLLIGIGHDGNSGAWRFPEFRIVDLASLKLRLKPEFQASNAALYPEDS
ncbi:MAG: hypothetical protein ACQKBU_09720, partial [Verrucomicrobiales bacterium]